MSEPLDIETGFAVFKTIHDKDQIIAEKDAAIREKDALITEREARVRTLAGIEQALDTRVVELRTELEKLTAGQASVFVKAQTELASALDQTERLRRECAGREHQLLQLTIEIRNRTEEYRSLESRLIALQDIATHRGVEATVSSGGVGNPAPWPDPFSVDQGGDA